MAPTTSLTDGRGGKGRARRLALMGGPMTRPISGRRFFPLYGVIHHVGRRSGRAYATPVVVRRVADRVFVPLPFGETSDWYRNASAAGDCLVTWRGRSFRLVGPRVVGSVEAKPAFNGLMRGLMRAAGIGQFVRFEVDTEETASSDRPA